MGDQKARLSGEKGGESEETRVKANRRRPEGKKLKAQGMESTVSPTISSLKGQADILGDKRFSAPTNRARLANTLVSLQRQQGNAWVQKVVAQLRASAKGQTEGAPGNAYEREAERVVQRPLQRQPEKEEEELLQGKLDTNTLQRQVEEEEIQMKAEDLQLQRQEEEEEEEIQAQRDEWFPLVQLQEVKPEEAKEPPKTTKDPKEVLGKVVEAAMKTETGKKVTDRLKKAATSEEGIATLSMLAVPTLATMFAEKMEVPQALVDIVPKVAKFELGKDMEIAFQPIYKGKFGERPKEWGGMVTFTVKNW